MGASTQQDIKINNTTWTQVLGGEGFAYCAEPVIYAYGDSTPPADLRGIKAKAHMQVDNPAGSKLWAKSVFNNAAYVIPNIK